MKKVIVILLVVSQVVGCAKTGLEARVGFYREDASQQSSYAAFRPLKCYFTECTPAAEERDVRDK